MHNIIFIDDELEILNSYRDIFKSQDPDVLKKLEAITGQAIENENSDINAITSSSGQDGISLVKKYKNDQDPIKVAFIDMRMPNGINGLETAKEIHQVDSRVEIVFVTAYSDVNLKEINTTLKRTNKVLFLKKPFQEEVIQQTARNLISKYEATVAKDNFISSMSHEIKTPISAILGFSSILKDMVNDKDEKEMANLIYDSSNILNNLIENLMQISLLDRVDTNNIEMVDVGVVVNKVLNIVRPKIKEKNLKLAVEIDSLELKTDENKLIQVLLNLIDNAIKFTNAGHIEVIIGKDCYNNFLEIKDTGIGMSPDEIENIFNKFHRIEDTHHNKEGLGLGLYICKKVLNQLNHKIEVESEEGVGSSFKIIF